MAIRLEVHSHVVHLSEITVVDRAQIPLLAATSPDAGIQYQRMTMAEALFERLVAAGIWVDADSKNRFLYDFYGVVDAAYIHAQKAFGDTTSNSDALDLFIEKHFDEIIGFIETREFDITTSRSDSAVVSDLKQLALTHPEQDTYSVSETNSWLMDKGQSDAASAVDAFARQVTFERLFSDVVAVDDVMNIDKLWDSTKGNVAFIGDVSNFLLARSLSDTATAVDAYDLSTAQLKTDSVLATDASAFDFTRFSAETVATADAYDFYVTQAKAETLAPFDAYNLNLSQLKTEAINASDAATVIHYLGAAQLFNRPLFNQTTLG